MDFKRAEPTCYRTYFPLQRAKFRNWAMLYDVTLIEIFDPDIVILASLKCFVMMKVDNFTTSTRIRESVS